MVERYALSGLRPKMEVVTASTLVPSFSTFIRHNLDAVVAEWETFARSLDTTQRMTTLALRDHCREILLGVADEMEVDQTARQKAAKSKGLADSDEVHESPATTHGALRQLSGFDLVQLVSEFRALRASVLALWQRSLLPSVETGALEENIRFNEAIDRALAESVKSYAGNVESSREMFLAILGHDLRGPLSSINLCSALLGKPELSDASRLKAATRVKQAVLEMSQLITDLLEYTRSCLGAGIPIELADCDLGPVCEEAMESVRTSHPEQTFKFHATGDLHLEADAPRLHQVLSNLLNNAVQHGDRQAPVSVLAHGEAVAVVLKVCNLGSPIPVDVLPSIFEPLIQAPASGIPNPDERSKTSLGLGLFIVREIVHGHEGTVTVDSASDTGTVFTITLPRVRH
jgi:signal transduction histidine kinase